MSSSPSIILSNTLAHSLSVSAFPALLLGCQELPRLWSSRTSLWAFEANGFTLSVFSPTEGEQSRRLFTVSQLQERDGFSFVPVQFVAQGCVTSEDRRGSGFWRNNWLSFPWKLQFASSRGATRNLWLQCHSFLLCSTQAGCWPLQNWSGVDVASRCKGFSSWLSRLERSRRLVRGFSFFSISVVGEIKRARSFRVFDCRGRRNSREQEAFHVFDCRDLRKSREREAR